MEIYKYRAVIGISLIFLGVDLAGGFFSMLSLCECLPCFMCSKRPHLERQYAVFADGPFDILAIVSYGAVAVLELGVFCLVRRIVSLLFLRTRKLICSTCDLLGTSIR